MTDRSPGVLVGSVVAGKAGPKTAQWDDDAETSRVLAAIYRAHVGFVWRVVRRLGVPAEAIEDLVHEVFLVVRRRLSEVAQHGDGRAWLFMITRGVVSNDRRIRARRHRRHEDAPPPDPPVDPERLAAKAEAIARVEIFLSTLTDEQRVVFELVDIEGFTGPEVARVTEAPLDTVYSRLRLARAAFARFFAEGSTR
ncbi:MAG TPA: RNA polymerase sigma factor [Nannocystaceae bacterium]|nr:RNA polymerase sigma factor [Nannocystaceae bacterium]